ncbi:hypothetical protein OG21DRAFT_1505721 [Imleria badia]|nr:hypothetical protein OG21DRAFT_1505721 [Imleria badia]
MRELPHEGDRYAYALNSFQMLSLVDSQGIVVALFEELGSEVGQPLNVAWTQTQTEYIMSHVALPLRAHGSRREGLRSIASGHGCKSTYFRHLLFLLFSVILIF